MDMYPKDFNKQPYNPDDQEAFRIMMFIVSVVLFISLLACVISNVF